MIAHNLSPRIWNAIARLAEQYREPRQVYFCNVTKIDKTRKLIWVEEFGSLALPLVGFGYSFMYYDTQPSGSQTKRGDTSQKNDAYHVEIIMPKIGQTVAIVDPWGAKNFPFCIGIVQSKTGFWEGG